MLLSWWAKTAMEDVTMLRERLAIGAPDGVAVLPGLHGVRRRLVHCLHLL